MTYSIKHGCAKGASGCLSETPIKDSDSFMNTDNDLENDNNNNNHNNNDNDRSAVFSDFFLMLSFSRRLLSSKGKGKNDWCSAHDRDSTGQENRQGCGDDA